MTDPAHPPPGPATPSAASATRTEQAYVELRFCPSPELIPVVRRFVSAFYERLLSQPEVASRLALAAHELLENTVQYSVDGVSSIHLGVTPRRGTVDISIRTWNRASERDRANAQAIVDELRGSRDTFSYYQELMRKNARRRNGSGLGLARICAEADMRLGCEISDDELCLVAEAVIDGEARTTALELPQIASPTFTAASTLAGDVLRVRLTGNADLGAKSALQGMLDRVHAEAVRMRLAEVVVDFTGLEFMNSSCFRSFVGWLSDLQDLPPEQQYQVRLLADATVLWQRRSLHALRCFAHDLVRIES